MASILNTDITVALKRFSEQARCYDTPESYYAGKHNLAYATDKFENAFRKLFKEFALNLCPAVVDAQKDKLVITEFAVEEGGDSEVATKAWKIWQRNLMSIRSGEVHKEAAKLGDAYAIVWPNAKGEPTIFPNSAQNCTVFYDSENPGKILWAAKFWRREDLRYRLNLYYPDRIERYITRENSKTQELMKTRTAIMPAPSTFERFSPQITNPYGVVPVFHFANNGAIGSFGQSELTNAIPIQDALNKSVLDMMVAMEFAAFRQRWATGIEVEMDDNGKPVAPFEAGVTKLWATENAEAKFGDFEAADLDKFLKVKDSFKVDLASITGTPVYYFLNTPGDFPSGEALKKSESRFIHKIRDRQEAYGSVWQDVMSFALLIDNIRDVRLFAQWEDPSPLSEKEKLENLAIKKSLGVSEEQLWMEAGYGEKDIVQMQEANAKKQEEILKRFNAGQIGDEEER